MKISLKKVKKPVIYLFFFFICVTIVLIFVYIFVWTFDIADVHSKAYVESHKRAYTYSELGMLAKNIILTNLDTDEATPTEMDSLLRWLDTYSVDGREWRNEFEDCFDPVTNQIIDYWDMPIKLQVKSPREYVLISSGPNRKFENGKGDDIVSSFNPYEYVEDRK